MGICYIKYDSILNTNKYEYSYLFVDYVGRIGYIFVNDFKIRVHGVGMCEESIKNETRANELYKIRRKEVLSSREATYMQH